MEKSNSDTYFDNLNLHLNDHQREVYVIGIAKEIIPTILENFKTEEKKKVEIKISQFIKSDMTIDNFHDLVVPIIKDYLKKYYQLSLPYQTPHKMFEEKVITISNY